MSDGQDAINWKDYRYLEATAISVALRRSLVLRAHIRVLRYFRSYCAAATTALEVKEKLRAKMSS